MSTQKPKRKRTKYHVFYGLWKSATALFRQGGMTDEEIESERQHTIKLAGGRPDAHGRYSLTRLNNKEFNTALDIVETIILGRKNQKRRSRTLIWSIRQLGLDDAYLNKISTDQFRTQNWKDLSESDLTKLRYTATARARNESR